MIVGKAVVDAPHLGGVGIVPLLEFRWRHAMRLLEPAGQRLNQPPFHVAGVSRVGARKLDMIETALSCPVRFGLAMLLPGQVVEGPGAIGDAPMRHRTAWVEFQRLLKTLYALFVVEAFAPVQ